MIYIYIASILLVIAYCYKLRKFEENFNLPLPFNPKKNNTVPVSVIVAVKNGEDSLLNLIECLKMQTYTGEIEYIIVDDQSSDNTSTVIQNISKEDSRFKFASSKNGSKSLSYKKKALDAGIKLASFEWLLFTDVDCRPPKTWIQEMAEYFIENVDYVIGISKVLPSNSLVSLYQSIDFQMLMGATISQCNIKKPWACTGQNQAYRKSLYKKVEGFKHISNLLQGDDTVFMQLCQYADANIVGALTKNSMIARTENNLWSFLKQRMRWAGDSKYMLKLCPEFFIMSVITYLLNLSIFILVIFGYLQFLPIIIMAKIYYEHKFYETIVNTSIAKDCNHTDKLMIWAILQFPYIILMGTLSFWSHQLFGWKKSKN